MCNCAVSQVSASPVNVSTCWGFGGQLYTCRWDQLASGQPTGRVGSLFEIGGSVSRKYHDQFYIDNYYIELANFVQINMDGWNGLATRRL